MDDTYNTDTEWNKQNQYHPQNQPRPPGWATLTKTYENMYCTPHQLANLLCELHLVRLCISPPPIPWPKDIRGLEDLQIVHLWELDDLERYRWGVYKKILNAVAYGELPSESWGIHEEEDEYKHVEDQWADDADNRLMRIAQIVPWAIKNEIEVPIELCELAGIKTPANKRTNEGKAKAAREKRDATFAAALVLIQAHGIETYQHKNSGELNLSKLGKAIVQEQKHLMEEGSAPLSSTVFTRQFRTMWGAYQSAKGESETK